MRTFVQNCWMQAWTMCKITLESHDPTIHDVMVQHDRRLAGDRAGHSQCIGDPPCS
jgi:hypothetical protein